MAQGRLWTEDEVRQALALYLVTPFGRIHDRNPAILALAERLGRSVGSVALKLANLAALDDSLPRRGMANASATDRRVWTAFLIDPAPVEAAWQALQDPAPPPATFELAEQPAQFDHLGGQRLGLTRQRLGQGLFREMVLTGYAGRCALTGIDDARLLNASHILGWAESPEHRMRPTNGICLNALHDRAFDRALISFDEDWRMLVSPRLSARSSAALLQGVDRPLQMPARFRPDPELMALHRARFENLAA